MNPTRKADLLDLLIDPRLNATQIFCTAIGVHDPWPSQNSSPFVATNGPPCTYAIALPDPQKSPQEPTSPPATDSTLSPSTWTARLWPPHKPIA